MTSLDATTTRPYLLGEPRIAQRKLGRSAEKSFPELIFEIAYYDLTAEVIKT